MTTDTNVSTGIQEETIVGRAATGSELALLAWGDDLARRATSNLQELLRQLITLNTALLGGSAVLVTQTKAGAGLIGVVALCLITSLACSLIGAYPRDVSVCLDIPEEIEKAQAVIVGHKRTWLKAAMSALLFAFAALAAGLIIGAANS